MKAKDLMTPQPCCCSPDDAISEVASMMRDNDCGSVPVVEAGRVIGIVTDRDLAVRGLARGLAGDSKVRDVMTASPECCTEEDDIHSIERVMSDRQVRRVPIVNADGGCVGIISQADLARATSSSSSRTRISPADVAETVAEISAPN
ncbi:MAG TPA: CBS domain-containing protein [Gemmatimonadaceae bacterium]